MIFSEAKRIIFVHIPKTGGTSIQTSLQSIDDLPNALRIRTKHETLRGFCSRTNIDINGYTVLAVTRHPLERWVSLFHYLVKFKARSGKHIVSLTTADDLVHSLRDRDDGLMKTHSIKPQYSFLESGLNMKPDLKFRILRFESLEQDFRNFCQAFHLDLQLPRLNVSKSHDYRAELTSTSMDYLHTYYQKDFETFGYQI